MYYNTFFSLYNFLFCPGACNWLYLSLTFKKLIFIIFSIIFFKLSIILGILASSFLFRGLPSRGCPPVSIWVVLSGQMHISYHLGTSRFSWVWSNVYTFLVYSYIWWNTFKGVSNKKVGGSLILWVLMSMNFNSWVRKICWRRDRLPTLVFLGFPCGLAGKESACNAGDLGWGDPLKKGKATHFSILAWRIPWTV